ncbi:small integral membrane protein 15-like [Centruroides sculpturatus]|uniref:small integral membrane protein 15-like n=1 Tax=Centruroides sculpturatus TaxID=218467 RepID=UPI000C6CC83D|nr:small integral membrane protein 15-like [Centruroides sculpturatus]
MNYCISMSFDNCFIMRNIDTWKNQLMDWVADRPWEFLLYILVSLSPFFIASLVLSMKLSKELAITNRKLESKRYADLRDEDEEKFKID